MPLNIGRPPEEWKKTPSPSNWKRRMLLVAVNVDTTRGSHA